MRMTADAVLTGRLLSKNTRPQNVVYSGLLAATVAYVRQSSIVQCLACYLLILCLYAVAASLNNIADIQTDILNKRTDNPLVGQLLKRHEFTWFVGIILCGVVALQPFLRQPYSAVIALVYLILAYAYSNKRLNLQARGLWGTILLCLCYSVLPLLLGAFQMPMSDHMELLQVAIWTIPASAPIILAKDYKDLTGDKLTGKMTPLVRYGAKKLHIITLSVLVLTIVLYVLLAITYKASIVYTAVSATIYVLLTVLLHLKHGTIPKLYKSTLMFVLIALITSLMHSVKS